MTEERTINPELVVLAREYRELTQLELAEKMNLGQSKIAKLEGGIQLDLTEDQWAKLCSTLGFERRFFYQDWVRLGFGSSAFYYRKKAKLNAADRRRISSVVNLHLLGMRKYLESVDVQPARELPQFEPANFGGDCSDIAQAVRTAWKLPDGPIKDLTALIESAGVLIVPCDFQCDAMDATSLRLASFPPVIFINSAIPGDRWRYTLAHELGHLVMHQVPSETMEDEADAFAGEFLMPETDIVQSFKTLHKLDLYNLIVLKQFWRVSVAALIVRAGRVGFITEHQQKYLWMQMAKLGFRRVEPEPIPKEKVQNYPNLFSYLLKELRLSVEDVAGFAAIPQVEFLALHASVLPPDVQQHPRLRLVK